MSVNAQKLVHTADLCAEYDLAAEKYRQAVKIGNCLTVPKLEAKMKILDRQLSSTRG